MRRLLRRSFEGGAREADGLWHERWGRRAFLAVCAAAGPLALRYGPWPVWFALGFWIGVYLVTPDCDFLSITRAESRWFRDPRRGDPLSWVGAVVRFPVGLAALALGFLPGLILSHRGVSHTPVLGAAVIAVLALPIPAALLAWAGKLDWLVRAEAGVVWLGFAAAHLLHILLDKLG